MARSKGSDSDTPDAATLEEREVKRWQERKRIAWGMKKKWIRKFQCDKNWDWYYGYQGHGAHETGDPEVDRYITNLIYSIIEVKLPSYYFRNPKATVIPRPQREDDVMTTLQERARLREDTVNSFMLDPRLALKKETDQGLKESFFYLGWIETGYSGHWIENPHAGRPILDGDTGKPLRGKEGEVISEPPVIQVEESIYWKHIPAKDIIVSARSHRILERCDWYGYREWFYASDLRKDPAIANRDKIKATGEWDSDYTGKIDLSEGSMSNALDREEWPVKQGMVLGWRIWDTRTRTKFIIPDEGSYYLMYPTPYKVDPMSDLKHHECEEGYWPMPPVFAWKSPQAEYNDIRQKQRTHRKRADRKYQHQKGAITADEKVKLEEGGDMTIIETNGPVPAIMAVEDARLDSSIFQETGQTLQDLMRITAIGGEQQQIAESQTATQATVIETRARIRESFGQENVAAWVSDIARKTLLTIEAHMALPFWIKRNVDPVGPMALQEAMTIATTWQEITADELGELSYDVAVAAETMSPINDDLRGQRIAAALDALTKNPALMLFLRTSDFLLREWLSAVAGIRNEKAIQQIKLAIEVALLAMSGGASAQLPSDSGESGAKGMLTSGGPGGPGGPGSPAPNASLPGIGESVQQTRDQMGLPG